MITLSFDLFTRLPLFFLIGKSNNTFFFWFYDIGLKRVVYQRDINNIACIYAPLYALQRIKDQQMIMEVSIFVYVSNLVILFLLLQECCKEGLQRASTKPTARRGSRKCACI